MDLRLAYPGNDVHPVPAHMNLTASQTRSVSTPLLVDMRVS